MRVLRCGVVIVACFLAVACTADDLEPSASPPASSAADTSAPASSPPQTPIESEDAMASCLVGVWSLDIALYRNDAHAFVLSTGQPVETLDIVGQQLLTFGDDGLLTIATDMTVSATVMGHPITEVDQSVLEGTWDWREDLVIEDLSYLVEPTASSTGDVGIMPSYAGPYSQLECDPVSLLIQGGGPIPALFYRIE